MIRVGDIDHTLSDSSYTISSIGVGDKVIIMCYCQMSPEEVSANPPRVVFVDDDNKIARVTRYEKHGLLKDME